LAVQAPVVGIARCACVLAAGGLLLVVQVKLRLVSADDEHWAVLHPALFCELGAKAEMVGIEYHKTRQMFMMHASIYHPHQMAGLPRRVRRAAYTARHQSTIYLDYWPSLCIHYYRI